MKRIIVIVFVLLFATPVFSQDIFSYLTENYADNNGFSATKITNDMFDLYLRKKNIEKDSPVYETLKKLDNILVVSQNNYESDNEIDLSDLHDEILSNYQDEDYDLFKTEKKMGEDIKVYLKKENEKVSSLALVTASESSVTLIEMNGDIDLANLSELSKVLNLRGLEALYKVNSNSYFYGWDGNLTLPDLNSSGWVTGDFDFRDFNSNDYFTGFGIEELQKRIEEQNFLSQEQKTLLEKRAWDYSQKQKEMAEKYRQMAEQYGRNPIFLTYPGDTTNVYFIDGKKVKAEDVKNMAKSNKIQGFEVKTSDDGKKTIILTTKKIDTDKK
ncbi:MAG: DUF4252 domain-containing protein [Prolixibacteraceae bacterium]|nr:DUF4252 domain-containing protein [Prolixibacteraceae bacterium]